MLTRTFLASFNRGRTGRLRERLIQLKGTSSDMCHTQHQNQKKIVENYQIYLIAVAAVKILQKCKDIDFIALHSAKMSVEICQRLI